MSHMFMPMYNVDAPVGPGATNNPADVKLVQCLFRVLINCGVFSAPGVSLATLSPSGQYGPDLDRTIRAFQASAHIEENGMIEPIAAREGHFEPRSNGRTSTLALMNLNACRRGAHAHFNLAQELRLRIHITL